MTALGYLTLGLLTYVGIGRLAGDDLDTLQIALGIAFALALLEVAQQLAHLVRAHVADTVVRDEARR